ncbi:helix-turn-helix domain-containing protein [Schaalia sp. lx-260]|uniref:helix-turn-helix domain-containing protein n=1 Tax=Schaalia sp. lx-260 TaxID=2899082 RepID=UPI001E36E015|nr:helix-turn-helix transcriptional regulator [Schaalia sp. lx-260]MCD4549700.1 helix-turn-helix domain-containing protein [Schaalia sp. lx-260]
MGNPLITGEIDQILSEILDEIRGDSGLSLRGLSEASGIKLTRLGDILRRGRAMTGNEIHAIAAALDRSGWRVFREAEERLEAEQSVSMFR